MPALLSPRSSSKELESDAAKKPKGVMGRIKSTFKLGRRKSSSSSDSPSIAAAAEAAAAAVADGKESSATAMASAEQDNDTDPDVDDKEVGDVIHAPRAEKTEIKQFRGDDDDAGEPAQLEVEPSKIPHALPAQSKSERATTLATPVKACDDKQHAEDEQDEDEEVFACDYKPGEGPRQDDEAKESRHIDEDEDIEVFAENEDSNQSNRAIRPVSLPPPETESPPAPAAADLDYGAPRESDLMVIGVSPSKLRGLVGPTASPAKRSQPPPSQPLHGRGNQDSFSTGGPSREDAEQQSLGDRVASDHATHSTRPSRQPTVPISPAGGRRAQLLSDFQFGTEGAIATVASVAHSPVPSSPMRRGRSIASTGASSPSLQPRRSFNREQELHVSTTATSATATASSASSSPAASPTPKRKPDTPSVLSSSLRGARSERRPSLQGISEEDTAPPNASSNINISEEAKIQQQLRPRPSAGAGRRRVAAMEAPILASSFVALAPEVHDDHHITGEARQTTPPPVEEEEEDHDAEAAAGGGIGAPVAFSFDAGAAITHEFGERVARLLGADPWGDRQDGFDAILYQIKKTDLANAKNKRELFCAAVAAIQGGVDDRVAPVMYCALDCLKSILKEYAPVFDRTFLKYHPTNEQLSALVKAIVGKVGDSNKRTQREASQAVLRLAKLKKLKVLPHVLLHLSAKDVAPRQRVETLRQLVHELGVDSKTAMNVEVVMQFAVPVLKIADEKTRKSAVELIAELHLINGQAVNAQLVGVKPEMLRIINRRVDELMVKREEERSHQQQQQQQQQASQNANQSEESNDDGDARTPLVAVPSEDAKAVQTLLETLSHHAQGVVGPVTWRKLESKTWSDRKEALVDVDKTITEAKSDLRDVKPAFHSVVQQNFTSYCMVVYKCLGDSIAPVVNGAMDCFSTLIKVYGPCVEWREDAVRDMILLTIMRLFSTMQKPNNRTNRAACRCILKLTRLTNPHTLRYTLSCVFAKDTDALVQMHLLRLLVPEFGFQQDGINASQVLELVAAALGTTNDKVRKTATDVALCTQRLMGKAFVILKLKDVVKPVTLKELEKNFVDLETQKDSERPQTVHATAMPSAAASQLPPVQFGGSNGGGDHSRRQLNSAPVGLGRLHCTPPNEDERDNSSNGGSGAGARRNSVLSNDEENLMDSILGNDDF